MVEHVRRCQSGGGSAGLIGKVVTGSLKWLLLVIPPKNSVMVIGKAMKSAFDGFSGGHAHGPIFPPRRGAEAWLAPIGHGRHLRDAIAAARQPCAIAKSAIQHHHQVFHLAAIAILRALGVGVRPPYRLIIALCSGPTSGGVYHLCPVLR